MLGLARNAAQDEQRLVALQSKVSAFLYAQFCRDDSAVSRLDRWTQRRVSEENLAKVALVLEAGDPVEYCYQNLIREIDTEAEAGIYLVRAGAAFAELRKLSTESGISGKLYQHMPKIAPVLFADALEHSNDNLDIVWVSIEAQYDRAHIDAGVSELVMANLTDNSTAARDMCDAMRSLLYAFHEDLARRRSELPLILNERATRDLLVMIAELSDRSGDYEARVQEICARAGTA